MDSNSPIDPQHWTVQTTESTTVSTRPTAVHSKSEIFSNAHDNTFNNNMFITNIKSNTESPLSAVNNRVAPNAIRNAVGRPGSTRCYPGTRLAVIDRIENWRTSALDGATSNRLFWLSGPAGDGKTAIVQTVAESWAERGIHTASFFFSRTDVSRNHPDALVSTLLYQIFDFYPAAREAVETILGSKPRILDASIKEQFEQLICATLRSIGTSFSDPIIFLIDGLDECDSETTSESQRHILHALNALVIQSDLPLLALVSSRDVHQIRVAFKELSSTVDSTFLDKQYSPEKDIRLFVTAEFDRIKRTHSLAPQDANWPSALDIDVIVARSSGQFIYATTVMRSISQSPADPRLSLARVQNSAQMATKSPFANLDAMYTDVLAHAEDQQALKDILCAHAVCQYENTIPRAGMPVAMLQKVLCLYNNKYTDSDIRSCIAAITAIARLEDGILSFYHSSLDDYLKTQSRSGPYYLDVSAFMIKILPGLWKQAKIGSVKVHGMVVACMYQLSRGKTIAPELWGALLSFDPPSYDRMLPKCLRNIYDRCTGDDDVANYRRVLRKWITHYISGGYLSTHTLDDLYCLPHGHRYLTMAQIDRVHGDTAQNPDITTDTLRSKSAFDARETASWIHSLLWRIHGEYYPRRLETYRRLIKQWISWALSNDIPLAKADDLPQDSDLITRGGSYGVANQPTSSICADSQVAVAEGEHPLPEKAVEEGLHSTTTKVPRSRLFRNERRQTFPLLRRLN